MAEIAEKMSLDKSRKVIKIVLKRCPRTEKAVQELLVQNGDSNDHHPCPVCGSTEKCNGSGGNTRKMSPVGVDLFQNLVFRLDPDGSSGGDSPTLEGVQNFGCTECLGKFDMLESLQNEISLLENKVEEILCQLRKTIRDRRGVISLPNFTVFKTRPGLDISTQKRHGKCSDIGEEENPLTSTVDSTPTMTTAQNYEDVDMKPVILHFRNELDGNADGDNGDDEHSSKNESDADSDNTKQDLVAPKGRYKRPGIASKKLQKKNAKRICTVCGKRVTYLSHHMRLHRSRVSCEICSKTFSTSANLVAHGNTVHLKQFRHKCEKCGKEFYARAQLQLHLNRRNPCTEWLKSRKFTCPICKAGCSSPQSLQRHIRLVDGGGEKKVNCQPFKLTVHDTMPVLDKMTHGHVEMSDIGDEGGNPPTLTPVTAAENYDNVDLKPVIIHFPDEFDEGGSRADDLLGGVDLISEEQPMNIPVQDQRSPNKSRRCKIMAKQAISALIRNDGYVDGDNEGDEYSPKNESESGTNDANELEFIPNEKYQRPGITTDPSTKLQKKDTKRHSKFRSDRKRISCEICHNTFSTRANLAVHRNTIHLQQFRHKCERCGKNFYFRSHLQLHLNMRIPCNEVPKNKKFFCLICKRGYSSRDHLVRHTRTVHNGEKTKMYPKSKFKRMVFDESNFQRQEEVLSDRVGGIPKQIGKTILDQQRVKSQPLNKPELDTTSQSHSRFSDMHEDEEQNPLISTLMMAENNEEEVDLKPVILHFRNELDQGDDGSADGDNGDDEYSPKNESDVDDSADDGKQLGLDSVAPKKGRYKRPGIASKKVQKKNAKRICTVCGKRVKYLSHHMRLHRSRVSCEICDKTFSTSANLAAHRNTVHLKQFRHKCEKCGKEFYARGQFQLHLNRRNPCTKWLKSRKFICSICKAGCSSPQSLQRHIRLVHGEERKVISQTLKLPVHDTAPMLDKMTHSGMNDLEEEAENPPTSTPITTAEDYDDVDLKPVILYFGDEHESSADHLLIRSDGKRVSCEICHKTFSTQANLTVHRKVLHLQQGRHKCDRCGKGFGTLRNLNTHLNMRIPCTQLLEDKKFICLICKRGFTTKDSLLRHTRTVHNGDKKFICLICKRGFTTKESLLRHTRTVHNGEKRIIYPKSKFKRRVNDNVNSTTAETYDDEVEVDLIPVVLDDEDDDDSNAYDPLGGVDSTSDEHPIKFVNQDQPIATISRSCNIRPVEVISTMTILPNDDNRGGDDNVNDDQYSPKHQSDTDSGDTNEAELDSDNQQEGYNQKGEGIESHAKNVCLVCGKEVEYLTRHMKSHQFRCGKCGKEFRQASRLERHLNMRTPCIELLENKRFICLICNAGYSCRSTLNHHTRQIHIGDKRIKCPHNNCKTKVYKTDLQDHLERYHSREEHNLQ